MGTTNNFHLFGPPGKKDPALKDLLFKDSAVQLKQIPSLMDSQLYLGFEYYSAVQSLQKGRQDIKHQCHVSMGCVEELALANRAWQKEHDVFSDTDCIVCKIFPVKSQNPHKLHLH